MINRRPIYTVLTYKYKENICCDVTDNLTNDLEFNLKFIAINNIHSAKIIFVSSTLRAL